MCKYHGQEKVESERLPFDKFKDVAEQLFPAAEEFHPTVKGEPLMTPYFEGMLEVMERFGVRLNLTTNGTLLTEEKTSGLIHLLRDVKFSFDGASKRTFEAIRNGARFEQVKENIRAATRVRDEYVAKYQQEDGFRRPTVTIQAVLMTTNIHELPDMVRLGKELGVDRVKGFNLMVLDPEFIKYSLLFDQERANIFITQAVSMARRFGLQTKYQEPFDLKRDVFRYEESGEKRRNCEFLWRQINIEPNGDVTPCCHVDAPVMGNIYREDLRTIWNNEMYQDMRASLDTTGLWECCKTCAMLDMRVLDAKAFIFVPLNIVERKEGGR